MTGGPIAYVPILDRNFVDIKYNHELVEIHDW